MKCQYQRSDPLDLIEVTLVFDGNDANNEWFLMEVVFEEKVL